MYERARTEVNLRTRIGRLEQQTRVLQEHTSAQALMNAVEEMSEADLVFLLSISERGFSIDELPDEDQAALQRIATQLERNDIPQDA